MRSVVCDLAALDAATAARAAAEAAEEAAAAAEEAALEAAVAPAGGGIVPEARLWEVACAPTTLAAVIGHGTAKQQLQRALAAGRTGILLVGPSGIGKTLLARLALGAAGYDVWAVPDNDDGGSLEACLTTHRLAAADSSPQPMAALVETLEGLTVPARRGLAALLRRCCGAVRGGAVRGGAVRGAVRGSATGSKADGGADGGADEEGVRSTMRTLVVITVDSEYDPIARPFLPLCEVIRLHRADDLRPTEAPAARDIEQVLRRAQPHASPDLLRHIAAACRGNVRAAVNALQMYSGFRGPRAPAVVVVDDALTSSAYCAALELLRGPPRPLPQAQAAVLDRFDWQDGAEVAARVALAAPAAVAARVAASKAAAGVLEAAALVGASATASVADVLFARMAHHKTSELGEAALAVGAWGVAVATRASGAMPPGSWLDMGDAHEMHALEGGRARTARLLATALASTDDALTPRARALLLAAAGDKAGSEAAEAAWLSAMVGGAASGGGGGAAGGGAGSKRTCRSADLAAVMEARAEQRRRLDDDGADAKTVTAVECADNATLAVLRPRGVDAHERLSVLRAQANAALGGAGGAAHGARTVQAALMGAHLWVADAEARRLLLKGPFD